MSAHLAQLGYQCHSHSDRQKKMDAAGVPDDIYKAYKMLQDLSEQSRYLLTHFRTDFVQSTVVEKYLDRVARFVNLDEGNVIAGTVEPR